MKTKRSSLIFNVFMFVMILSSITFIIIKWVDDGRAQTEGPRPTSDFPRDAVLEHISQRENIPVERLIIIYNQTGFSEWLEKEFWFVKVEDIQSGKEYGVQIDLSDNSFIDDINEIRSKELDARWAKYGKMDRELSERLRNMGPDELVPVLIRITIKERSEEDLYSELASKYPEAEKALEQFGNPFEVNDLKLTNQIENEYMQLREDSIRGQIKPTVDYLKVLGYKVSEYFGAPFITSSLPKKVVSDLVQKDDVVEISFAGYQEQPALDTAVPSDRVPSVWTRGIQGSNISIGSVETGTISTSASINIGQVRTPCGDTRVNEHKTETAGDAASYNSTYRGIAPQAFVNDACENGYFDDVISALQWATSNSEVINSSITMGVKSDYIQAPDKAYDYWARYQNDTLTVVAGNWGGSGGSLGTPGKGYNVITVGGSDDSQTTTWNDDSWWSGSSWINPKDLTPFDREKPEIVAPAAGITQIDLHNPPPARYGTSYAAPQVAGLAALLIDRFAFLAASPNAVKAIILASSMHNVEGTSKLSDKDGAGAIDASIADIVASKRGSENSTPCSGPCWWSTHITPYNFPLNGTPLQRYFQAEAEEKIRVAIAWWSYGTCPDLQQCYSDFLSTDLDLHVYGPTGLEVTPPSASLNNNFEIVEFVAPLNGQYKIEIVRNSILLPPVGEQDNYVGIAWAKDATYLPDLRNKNGWVSTVYVRNDSALARDVTIDYFQQNGTPTVRDTCSLQPNEYCWLPVDQSGRLPANSTGTAVVGGGEDVTVVVENNKSDTTSTNYVGFLSAGQSGNPDWDQVSPTLYAPTLKYNHYGRTTTLNIMNVGAGQTTITVTYYDTSGNQRGTSSCTAAASGQCVIQTPNISGYSLLAGKITNSMNYPMAAVVSERDVSTETQISTHHAIASGSTTLYAPLIKNNSYSQTTGLRILNVSASTADVYVYYYESVSPYRTFTNHVGNLPANGSVTLAPDPVLPSGFVGSAVVSSSYPVVAEVHESGTVRKMASNVFAPTGSVLSFASHICQNCGLGYTTGLRVMNVGSSNATITINYYYNTGGDPIRTETISDLAPDFARNASQIPAGIEGSAIITSNQPIVVVVNLADPDTSKDRTMTYSAPNR